jgi:hypothetical protein
MYRKCSNIENFIVDSNCDYIGSYSYYKTVSIMAKTTVVFSYCTIFKCKHPHLINDLANDFTV